MDLTRTSHVLTRLSIAQLACAAGLALVGVSTAAGATVLPRSADQGIARSLPRWLAYAPTRVPVGWRYHAWDAGKETPTLFPRGHGLNIWFSTPPNPHQFCARCAPRQPEGAGFHVYADSRCSTHGAFKTFRIGKIVVAWSSTSEDALAWRCVRGHVLVSMSVSYAGIGVGPHSAEALRIAVRHAAVVAKMLAGARPLPAA